MAYEQVLPKCLFGELCTSGITFNKSDHTTNQVFTTGFDQVYLFELVSFNYSWVYGEVKFPVWENSYSGIHKGFITSSAAAA